MARLAKCPPYLRLLPPAPRAADSEPPPPASSPSMPPPAFAEEAPTAPRSALREAA